MLIDGRKIADDILAGLKDQLVSFEKPLRLAVFSVAPNAATKQFTNIKKKAGQKAGVDVDLIELRDETTTEELISHVKGVIPTTDGIVVQLPLPAHIDFEEVRKHIPASHDVDCLGSHGETQTIILAPVTAAFKKILEVNSLEYTDKNIVIIGRGRLVGAPAATFFESAGAHVIVCGRSTENLSEITRAADIIILGAGVPNLLTPEMIKDGVVILDAGTSESEGKMVGDAAPKCVEKASFMTPVPGGVGPVAVAMLFSNLVTLYEHNNT